MTKKKPPGPNAPRGKAFESASGATAGRSSSRDGVPNKLSVQCKNMIATCFDSIGGKDGFETWAKNNRTAFYTRMYVRLLGVDINIIQDDDHKKIAYETIEQVNERLGKQGLTLEMLLQLREYEEQRPKLIEHVRVERVE
jgi:hypothetical protein